MKHASLHPAGMEPLTRMELAISYVLRSGVVLSAVIILVGTVLFALRQDTGYARVQPHHLTDLLAFHQTQGPGYFPATIPQVVAGTLTGKPYAIIGLGMLLLIATPVIRVALSVFFFLAQGDWLYVGITLFVLAVLILSSFAGIG
ncbi:MAG TPA: DUF1634 domain-containing protein [Candidatus Methylomirabilis sp.]|nr:DUF1634 domain-containing protein [Candidatus Methylomirabilis sp.]